MFAPRLTTSSLVAGTALHACTLLAVVATSLAASAAPVPEQKASAEALFQQGKALMTKGQYAEACRKLEESQTLDPQPGTLLSLAMCHENEGEVASAWAEYQEALALAKQSRRQDRIHLAQTRLKALDKVVPRMALEIDSSTAPAGLVVTRNGIDIGQGAWGVAMPVNPGEHALVAAAPGYVSWKVRVRLDLGETKHIPVPALERVPATPPPPAPSTQKPEPPPPLVSTSSSRSTWGWIVGGAGLASLAVGGYFGLRALSKESESKEDCKGLDCGRAGYDLNHDALRSANVANVLVPLGLVGIGLGTWLIASESKSESKQQSVRDTTHIAGGWVPGHASVMVHCPW